MDKNWINAIGLMSGTSLDGLDIVHCAFKYEDSAWSWKIIEAATIAYDADLENKLASINEADGAKLTALDLSFGSWMGEQVNKFLTDKKVQPDLIASHGHTVFHQPGAKLTLQIGNINALYATTGIASIGNFRILDVLKGGQGAPLVPVGDQELFGHVDFCLNLGGISNISYADHAGLRRAFDISICNIGLNILANELNLAYDAGGEIAAKGKLDQDLFDQLNAVPYYKQPIPKSLGKEDLDESVLQILNNSKIPVENKMTTLNRHIAIQISSAIKLIKPKGNVMITGGGAFNQTLINNLQQCLGSQYAIIDVDKQLINYKEALIFAFLGLLRSRNAVNVLSTVTGADSDSVAGDVAGRLRF